MISVIVPVYKVEPYLQRCIDSILNQTHREFELILIDDGSPDKCGKICDDYASRDSRIRVIHQTNKGLSEARNSGMKIAKGEFILFCDSDDYVDSEWIQSFLPYISYKHDNFIFGGFISQGIAKSVHVQDATETREYEVEEFIRLHTESKAGFAWNVLYYTDVLRDNDIWFSSSVIIEDLPFNLAYIKHMSSLVFTGECHYHYVQYPSQTLSKKYYQDGYKKWQEKFNELFAFIDERVTIEQQEKLRNEIATFYLFPFLNVLNDTFDSRNKKGIVQKLEYNASVVKHPDFQLCLKYADISKENGRYINLLKKKRYYMAYLYQKLADYKKGCLEKWRKD